MDVRFLGGACEVGRSAILVDETLLLDFGMKTDTPPQFPVGGVRGEAAVDPEAVVVSHGYLDHVGTLPALLSGDSRPPIHWAPPTRDLALRLAEDTLKLHGGTYDCPFTETEVRRLTQVSETHGYREPFEAAGYEVTFYDAGHIPGSANARVVDGRDGQRKRIAEKPAAIVTTSGMLRGEDILVLQFAKIVGWRCDRLLLIISLIRDFEGVYKSEINR